MTLSTSDWIYNYLCNKCLSPLQLWVRTMFRRGILDKTLCDKVWQWIATGVWFSLGTLVSSTNKTDCHYTTEILLKVELNTITLPSPLDDINIMFIKRSLVLLYFYWLTHFLDYRLLHYIIHTSLGIILRIQY
jgi:hypothetical protein